MSTDRIPNNGFRGSKPLATYISQLRLATSRRTTKDEDGRRAEVRLLAQYLYRTAQYSIVLVGIPTGRTTI